VERKIAKVNNVKLDYVHVNRGEECIVFVHGVGGDLTQFLNQIDTFSNYSILVVSLRGHGKSSLSLEVNSEKITIKTFAEDITSLLDYLGIRKYHYVGNSAGGIIGYELLRSNNEGIQSLITFGTSPKIELSPFVAKLIVGIDKFMIRNFSKWYFKSIIKAITNKDEVKKQTLKMFSNAKNIIPIFRGAVSNYNYMSEIKNIKIPYLIIFGEYDNEINKKLNPLKDEILSNKYVQIEEIENAGHLTNLDQPKKFNSILKKFLDNIG
jgi:pimeloyl-ACP methyl ester carboxylesterase